MKATKRISAVATRAIAILKDKGGIPLKDDHEISMLE